MSRGLRFSFNKLSRKLVTSSDEYEAIQPSIHTRNIQNAINKKHEMQIEYQGTKDKTPRIRTVIPDELTYDDESGTEQFHAYCKDSEGWRNFRTDPERLIKIHGTQPRSFEPPNDGVSKMEPIVLDHGPEPRKDLYNPTESEYSEIKAADLHPDSFDRATLKRLLNSGATIGHVREACKSGIPLEDYETSRDLSDSHEEAIENAKKYRENYVKNAQNRKAYMLGNGETYDNTHSQLTDDEHHRLVTDLFNHFAAARNRPLESEQPKLPAGSTGPYGIGSGDPGVHLETKDRKRANEWMMSECAKLEPSLRPAIKTQTQWKPQRMVPAYADRHIVRLIDHYQNKMMNEDKSLRNHMINRRMLQTINNIAGGLHTPMEYTPDKYEED